MNTAWLYACLLIAFLVVVFTLVVLAQAAFRRKQIVFYDASAINDKLLPTSSDVIWIPIQKDPGVPIHTYVFTLQR